MVIKRRRRFKQTQSLGERLVAEAARLRKKARSLPEGRLRDAVERKAIQFEAAFEVTDMLRSSYQSSAKYTA